MKRNVRNIPIHHDTTSAGDTPQPLLEPAHPVLQAVAAHLRDHKFNYAVMSGDNGLLFSMCDKTLSWITAVYVLEDKDVLCIRCRLPLLAPAARRGAVAAVLARLNFGKLIGSWQLDPDDGEVIYCTNHLFGDQEPTEEHIKILLTVSMNALCEEGPQILRLLQRPGRRPSTPPDPSRN